MGGGGDTSKKKGVLPYFLKFQRYFPLSFPTSTYWPAYPDRLILYKFPISAQNCRKRKNETHVFDTATSVRAAKPTLSDKTTLSPDPVLQQQYKYRFTVLLNDKNCSSWSMKLECCNIKIKVPTFITSSFKISTSANILINSQTFTILT